MVHEKPAPRTKPWGIWVLLAVVCVLTVPHLAEDPSTGLDPSWRVGLHLARDRGLTVGDDLFFTYGPWGFLTVPLTLTRPLWLSSVIFRLATHLALFVCLGLWVVTRLDRRCSVVAIVPLLLLIPQVEYRLLLALLLALAYAPYTGRLAPSLGAVVAAIGAATAMIKFSMGLAALAMVVGAIGAALLSNQRRLAASLAVGFAVGGTLAGLLALGSVAALGRFLAVSWQISQGYAEAQVRGGPLWQPLLVVLGAAALLFGLLRVRDTPLRQHASLLLPAAGLSVLVFKHAFIRQQTHAFMAFSVGTLLALWVALEVGRAGSPVQRALRAAGVTALLAGSVVLAAPERFAQLPTQFPAHTGAALRALEATADPQHRESLRQSLRRDLPLDREMLDAIGGRSVDVMTIETALIEAWELDWRPRRVLQSYAVGTAQLDRLDAAVFASESAPERLLVDLQGLDTRHPFMDSPRTWRVIFSRYRPLGRTRRWSLLGLRDVPLTVVETPLEQVRVRLNEAVRVPQTDAGHLELRVRLEPSWLGRLAGVAWKRPEVRLLVTAGQPETPRRIVAATANDPFPLVFPWADTPESLRRIFDEPQLDAPYGLSFFTGGSWAWKQVQLDFVQVEWQDGLRAEE
jgi:hypothetical protein